MHVFWGTSPLVCQRSLRSHTFGRRAGVPSWSFTRHGSKVTDVVPEVRHLPYSTFLFSLPFPLQKKNYSPEESLRVGHDEHIRARGLFTRGREEAVDTFLVGPMSVDRPWLSTVNPSPANKKFITQLSLCLAIGTICRSH